MNKIEAIQQLKIWDQKGRYVFTHSDLRKLFINDSTKAFNVGLARLVESEILVRACRGVYVNPYANCADTYILEHIAKALRRGEFNYVSLESMLVEYGAISQQLIDRLTIMTTGREGTINTPYGVIEFTHTSRLADSIFDSVLIIPNRPLRVATKITAWRDLKRAGRNIDMVDQNELKELFSNVLKGL